MSIRVKLLLSYAAMLVIPLVLIVLTAMLLVVVFRGDVQNVREAYGTKAAFWDDRPDERLLREIKRTAEGNPSLFTDMNYLNEMNQEMARSGAGLIVRADNRLTFVSDSLHRPDLLNGLPAFERPGHREEESAKQYGSELLAVTQYDFAFDGNRPGTVFVVKPVNPLANFARKFFPILFFSLLVILVLTHSLLTYFVSRSIIGPLRLMKKAAQQIKEGNLDFRVQVAGKDEIGQLGLAFEEMRVQLRDSIETKLQYEENRKELVSNISHDLKTPLTAIKGYVDGIQDGVADTPDKLQRYVKTIASKAEEMDHLIDELFLYSKLDLKRLPFNFERVDIGAFVQDCAEELRFELEKKGFRLLPRIELAKNETWVSADRDKLKRVISNIMDNCVKYMDKQDKQISLRAYEAADAVLLEITDNGQGIEPDALPHIFDRFYRAEQSRNTDTGGSGLGLAIAKQIVEGHGGGIEARSVRGEGTSISFRLPILSRRSGENDENDPDR